MKFLLIERPNEEINRLPWNDAVKGSFSGVEILELEADKIIWRHGVAYTLVELNEKGEENDPA